MSRTMTPGLLRLDRWIYTATVTAESLRTGVPIPRNIHKSACEFLRVAVEATRPGVPGNPVASASNYAAAMRILRDILPGQQSFRLELNSVLVTYAEGIKYPALASVHLVDGLTRFFDRMAELGEAERSRRRRNANDE